MKNFELQICVMTGDERGDQRNTIAISKSRESLEKYCEDLFDTKPVELSPINCPIKEHWKYVISDTYYTIIESNIDIV
jgi:hypothetical protein